MSLESQKLKVGKHEKAVNFVERNRGLFQGYAGGVIKIEPADPSNNTFSFNLVTNTIEINAKFYEKLGYPEAGTAFATLHEIEHFLEKIAMLREDGGAGVFQDYLDRLDKTKSEYRGKAWDIMDNCVADVRENRAVVSKASVYAATEQDLYRDVQFPDVDFVSQNIPKHLQLPYVILNEMRTGRDCTVDTEVRKHAEELKAMKNKQGKNLLEIMTDPNLPMSMRLKLQEAHIWPRVKSLLDQDIEEKKNDKKDNDAGSEGEKGDDNEGEDEQAEQTPDEMFADDYKDAAKRVPNAVPVEGMQKELEEWKKENDNPQEKVLKQKAERLGVDVQDLKDYIATAEQIENTKNPETGESVIEEMRQMLRRIISERQKPRQVPRYPMDEGDELIDSVGAYIDSSAGVARPHVWESAETKIKRDKKYGKVEISLVFDRTASMNSPSSKRVEQRKAAVLVMEALKEWCDALDEEAVNMEEQLQISTEIYTIQADGNDKTPIKKMSIDFTEKERVQVAGILQNTPGGSTPDYLPLQAVEDSIMDEMRQNIVEGELKKLVIVMTDGEGDDNTLLQKSLKALRAEGVIVVAIGITKGGGTVLTNYGEGSRVAERAEDLPLVLTDLLKEHLSDV